VESFSAFSHHHLTVGHAAAAHLACIIDVARATGPAQRCFKPSEQATSYCGARPHGLLEEAGDHCVAGPPAFQPVGWNLN
jgi:hypothetical protein